MRGVAAFSWEWTAWLLPRSTLAEVHVPDWRNPGARGWSPAVLSGDRLHWSDAVPFGHSC